MSVIDLQILPPTVQDALTARAHRNARSLEDEVAAILVRAALADATPQVETGLGDRMRARFEGAFVENFPLSQREISEPPSFE